MEKRNFSTRYAAFCPGSGDPPHREPPGHGGAEASRRGPQPQGRLSSWEEACKVQGRAQGTRACPGRQCLGHWPRDESAGEALRSFGPAGTQLLPGFRTGWTMSPFLPLVSMRSSFWAS